MTDDAYLYLHDHPAWARRVAPRWVELLEAADDERLLFLWRAAKRDLHRAVWALASDSLKARIETLTKANPKPTEGTEP